MKRLLLVIISIVFGFPAVSDAVQVRAYADQTSISSGESLQLTVSVSDDGGTVDISGIQDFKVISQGSSTSIQIVNGQMSKEIKYQYTLVPLKEGRLIIPRLPVHSDGQIEYTDEIVITVSNTPQPSSDTSLVYVEGTVSKAAPYEGESFIYSFRLYNSVQIANARFQKPEFTGFTAKEIEDRKSYRKIISGKEFNVTEVNFLLIPMKPGNLTIDPAILECDLVRRRASSRTSPFDSFFNDSFFGRADLERRVFRTEPVSVSVKSLPPYSGPGKFSGLVGKFQLTSAIDNTQLKVGESSTLSVTIEGTGNITDADEPQIKVPDAFKAYKDSPVEEIRVGADGYSGKKIYKSALVALKEGDYSIEPVSFSYFDVDSEDYKILFTKPLSFHILPPDQKDNLDVVSSRGEQLPSLKKKVEFTGRDILPIKDDLSSIENKQTISLTAFILSVLAPMILFFVVRLSLMLLKKTDDPAIIMAQRSVKSLQDACSASDESFFSCLYKAVVFQILSNAGIKGESLTYSEAEQILKNKGYEEDIIKRTVSLLEKIESAQFSGQKMEQSVKDDLLSETRQVIALIFRFQSFLPHSFREKIRNKGDIHDSNGGLLRK